MYLIVNILSVLAFIASISIGYYTFTQFAALDVAQRIGFAGLFLALTIAWVSGKIWMICNQHLNPKRPYRPE